MHSVHIYKLSESCFEAQQLFDVFYFPHPVKKKRFAEPVFWLGRKRNSGKNLTRTYSFFLFAETGGFLKTFQHPSHYYSGECFAFIFTFIYPFQKSFLKGTVAGELDLFIIKRICQS